MAETQNTSRARVLSGTVMHISSDTIRVSVVRDSMHPRIKKSRTLSKCYLVDAKGHKCAIGDKVNIREIKPVSKCKKFALVTA